MRKLFTIISCLLFAASLSFAKGEEVSKASQQSAFGVGAKASFDIDLMYGFEDDNDDTDGNPFGFGFDAGIMLRIELTKGLYFVPEVNFAYENTSHEVLDKTRSYSAMDLEIPLMIRATFSFLDRLYITAGPQIVLNMYDDSDIPSMVNDTSYIGQLTNTTLKYYDIEEKTEQGLFTFGIAAGIGYNIVAGLNVDFRFYMGLMELFPDVKTFGDDDLDFSKPYTYISMHGAKMMKFKIGVSYWFL